MLARTKSVRPEPVVEKPAASYPGNEISLHNEIIAHCRKQWPPWKYIHANPSVKSTIQKGAPDFPVIYLPGGKFISVECKSKDGKLDPDQLVWRTEVGALDHAVYVVRSMEEFLAAVAEVLK